MANRKSLTEESWEKIFEEHKILDKLQSNNVFKISAADIKKYREPRLMTKFDSDKARPEIFRTNNLSILPDTRGTYVIGQFEAYSDLQYQDIKPQSVQIPDYIRTFDEFEVTSEAIALNVAQMTGMIDKVLQNEEVDSLPALATITGRLKSGSFLYSINIKDNPNNKYQFSLDNSQVEIDAGFETRDKLAVIEAKNHIPENFMVRQLYYPYRIFNNLGTDKVVMPIYFTHSDGIYAFHIFKFTELNDYSSIKKVSQLNFIVDAYLNISIEDVIAVANNTDIIKSDDIHAPFPQADNFNRILDLLNRINEPIKSSDVTKIYEFDKRQSHYYISALIFLGFIKKISGTHTYDVTELGHKIQQMPNNNTRNLIIIKQILRDECFNIVFKKYMKDSQIDKKWVAKLLLDRVTAVDSSTAGRRAGSVISWINWIISVTTE